MAVAAAMLAVAVVRAEPGRVWGTAAQYYERGLAYQVGDGVPIDFERASGMFGTAALMGYAPAQFRLATLLIGGVGVDRDQVAAAKWLAIAAASERHPDIAAAARAMNTALSPQLRPQELEAAKQEATAFVPASDPLAAVNLTPSLKYAIAVAHDANPPTRQELAERLGVRFCGPPDIVEAPGGGYLVRGYRQQGGAQTISGAAKDWLAERRTQLLLVPIAYYPCQVASMVGALPERAKNLVVNVTNGAGNKVEQFPENTQLMVSIPVQDFSGIVSLHYLDHQGGIYHLVNPSDAERTVLSKSRSVVMGGPSNPHQDWQVAPPFGRDVLIVTVSQLPLYDQPRPANETSQEFLAFLRDRLQEPDVDTKIYYEVIHTVPAR